MRERRSGHVLLVSSSAAHVAFPNVVAYAATKAALSGFAASLRADLSSYDVRVTEVVPGRVETSLYKAVLGPEALAALYPGDIALQPEGRRRDDRRAARPARQSRRHPPRHPADAPDRRSQVKTAHEAWGFALTSRGLYIPVPNVGAWMLLAAACLVAVAIAGPIWLGRTSRLSRPPGERRPVQMRAVVRTGAPDPPGTTAPRWGSKGKTAFWLKHIS